MNEATALVLVLPSHADDLRQRSPMAAGQLAALLQTCGIGGTLAKLSSTPGNSRRHLRATATVA